MESSKPQDPRIEQILNLIMEFAYGNLNARETPSDNYDQIDGIIGGLNMLGEELQASTVSKDFLESIINSMNDALLIVDTDFIIERINPATKTLLGFEKDEIVGESIQIFFQESPVLQRMLFETLPKSGVMESTELQCISKNQESIPVQSSVFSIRDNVSNIILKYIFTLHDIRNRKRKEDELKIAAATFNTDQGILITDSEPRIIRVNQAFQKITGYSPEEVMGKNPSIISSHRHDNAFYKSLWKTLHRTGRWEGEIWNRRKNGQIYPEWLTITAIKNSDNQTTQYVAIFSDITKRKEAEEEIKNLAFYDALTSLPNRRLFLDRFHLALSQSERSKKFGAIIFMDLDKFKGLNDMMGHEYGDLLLIEVAKRISKNLRHMDTVARFGGDEFVILIEEISTDSTETLQKISLIAEKIRTSLEAPYKLKDYTYSSSSSIGVCLYCGNEKSEGELLKSADMAMYQAKESGRNTIRFFDPVMQAAVEKRALLEFRLKNALENNQFRLFYQIQVDRSGHPIGAEALVRWNEPTLGLILPEQFIHIAEESSIILELGRWVIDTACAQLANWSNNDKMKHLSLSVNISARQFSFFNFVEEIKFVLKKYSINASRLKLELTEHILLHNVNEVIDKMHALRELGVKLSIDDFGTGYSSLSYLKKLPINQLKIDKTFIQDVTTNPNDAIMVKTMISLGDNFHLDVIAEGVETKEQLAFLIDNGCLATQGFLFGTPITIEEFEKQFNK